MTGFSLTPDAPATPGSVFAAKVSRTDPIMVTIDSYGELHEWGPVTWLTPATPPVRGARALALIDDAGGVWAFGAP